MNTNELNNKYEEFKNRAISLTRIDFDHAYGYQCVDLVKAYLHDEFGITAGSWGNALNYWINTNKALNGAFTRVQTNDCKRGDIVVFRTAGHTDLKGDGHVGICEGEDGSNVIVLEQNGSTGSGNGQGGNAIRTRAIPRSRVAGVIRPNVKNPAPVKASGQVLHLDKGTDTSTFNKSGTKIGTIHAKDDSYDYKVLENLGNRVKINSASGGGNGVYVYLTYTATGQPVPGRHIK